jgi:hypothetical protein
MSSALLVLVMRLNQSHCNDSLRSRASSGLDLNQILLGIDSLDCLTCGDIDSSHPFCLAVEE